MSRHTRIRTERISVRVFKYIMEDTTMLSLIPGGDLSPASYIDPKSDRQFYVFQFPVAIYNKQKKRQEQMPFLAILQNKKYLLGKGKFGKVKMGYPGKLNTVTNKIELDLAFPFAIKEQPLDDSIEDLEDKTDVVDLSVNSSKQQSNNGKTELWEISSIRAVSVSSTLSANSTSGNKPALNLPSRSVSEFSTPVISSYNSANRSNTKTSPAQTQNLSDTTNNELKFGLQLEENLLRAKYEAETTSHFLGKTYCFTDSANVYTVMRYIPGATLDKYLKKPLTDNERAKIAAEFLQRLREIDFQDYTHTDLKASNIKVYEAEVDDTPKDADTTTVTKKTHKEINVEIIDFDLAPKTPDCDREQFFETDSLVASLTNSAPEYALDMLCGYSMLYPASCILAQIFGCDLEKLIANKNKVFARQKAEVATILRKDPKKFTDREFSEFIHDHPEFYRNLRIAMANTPYNFDSFPLLTPVYLDTTEEETFDPTLYVKQMIVKSGAIKPEDRGELNLLVLFFNYLSKLYELEEKITVGKIDGEIDIDELKKSYIAKIILLGNGISCEFIDALSEEKQKLVFSNVLELESLNLLYHKNANQLILLPKFCIEIIKKTYKKVDYIQDENLTILMNLAYSKDIMFENETETSEALNSAYLAIATTIYPPPYNPAVEDPTVAFGLINLYGNKITDSEQINRVRTSRNPLVRTIYAIYFTDNSASASPTIGGLTRFQSQKNLPQQRILSLDDSMLTPDKKLDPTNELLINITHNIFGRKILQAIMIKDLSNNTKTINKTLLENINELIQNESCNNKIAKVFAEYPDLVNKIIVERNTKHGLSEIQKLRLTKSTNDAIINLAATNYLNEETATALINNFYAPQVINYLTEKKLLRKIPINCLCILMQYQNNPEKNFDFILNILLKNNLLTKVISEQLIDPNKKALIERLFQEKLLKYLTPELLTAILKNTDYKNINNATYFYSMLRYFAKKDLLDTKPCIAMAKNPGNFSRAAHTLIEANLLDQFSLNALVEDERLVQNIILANKYKLKYIYYNILPEKEFQDLTNSQVKQNFEAINFLKQIAGYSRNEIVFAIDLLNRGLLKYFYKDKSALDAILKNIDFNTLNIQEEFYLALDIFATKQMADESICTALTKNSNIAIVAKKLAEINLLDQYSKKALLNNDDFINRIIASKSKSDIQLAYLTILPTEKENNVLEKTIKDWIIDPNFNTAALLEKASELAKQNPNSLQLTFLLNLLHNNIFAEISDVAQVTKDALASCRMQGKYLTRQEAIIKNFTDKLDQLINSEKLVDQSKSLTEKLKILWQFFPLRRDDASAFKLYGKCLNGESLESASETIEKMQL